jgi:hypothetical protein
MSEEHPIENKGFIDHFDADDVTYMVHIKHFFILDEEERKMYNVQEGQFLVHMFSNDGCKSFKLFLDDQLYWVTDSDESFIEREFVEIIGSIIDERSTLNKWD